ncbi:helix-turn-helix domain-containing protein [uncultured Pseudokineococcus sp.]|uniref:helix-turn-helix domain-containing protein n=1 Tax=uncultured Pseudokineococcus sp. TaxID=1642928 RepID=UPI0034184EAC
MTDGDLLTVAEVADALRVSRMTVYRLVHSGELPAVRVGRSYRVPEGAAAAFLAAARTVPGTLPGAGPADEQRRAGSA